MMLESRLPDIQYDSVHGANVCRVCLADLNHCTCRRTFSANDRLYAGTWTSRPQCMDDVASSPRVATCVTQHPGTPLGGERQPSDRTPRSSPTTGRVWKASRTLHQTYAEAPQLPGMEVPELPGSSVQYSGTDLSMAEAIAAPVPESQDSVFSFGALAAVVGDTGWQSRFGARLTGGACSRFQRSGGVWFGRCHDADAICGGASVASICGVHE